VKNKVFSFLLTLLLLGCSKTAPQHTAATLPFLPVAVTIPDTKEVADIESQTRSLFQSRDFDKLEAMADGFRTSLQAYPNGQSKLYFFYDALDSQEDAPASDWTNHFNILTDWVNTKPNSITARVALANEWIEYAWAARGGDYSDTVSDENWKLFFGRLNQAVAVLNESKTLDEKCPAWWVAMLRAELGLQVDRSQYDETFNSAIRAWPGYMSLYFNRANYLLPRWYGADGELETDLEKSANQIGGDAGDIAYAQVVWRVHHLVYSTNLFEEYNLSWDRTHRGLESLEKRYPDDLMIENEAAHLAVLGCDASAAKKYFDQTAGRVDLYSWSVDDYSNFASQVYNCVQ